MLHYLTNRNVQILVGIAAVVAATMTAISIHTTLSFGLPALTALQLIVAMAHGVPMVRSAPVSAETAQPQYTAASSSDSVAAFGRDFKDALLKGNYKSIKAIASNHRMTGMSRSTVYSAVSGTRLPTESTIRGLLTSVVEASEDDIRRWLDRYVRLATPAATGPTRPDAQPPRSRPTRYRYLIATAVGLLGAVAGFAATILIARPTTTATAETTASSTPPSQLCTPLADLRANQVPARVANTQGQGVFARIQPQQNCHTAFLPEGTAVTVVCQDLHGPTVTDVYGNTTRDWSVWDKLGSGAYVSDLYVDLPKNEQPGLVSGLPAC